MIKIHLKTNRRNELIDITSDVDNIIKGHGLKSGFIYLYCPHTTAGLTINENADPDVRSDIILSLNDIVKELNFKHMEGNSSAHVKSSLMGKHLQIAVEDSHMILGTWDGIYFCEFDGPRSRNVYVKLIKE